MAYLYYKNIGQGGRLGNQLFGIAATLGIAAANNMTPLFPANWKYRKDFNIPDEYFGECEIEDVYKEPSFHFTVPAISNVNTELKGYFQSEQYWHNIKDTVIEYLTPKGAKPGSTNAVSIHHRRGDYVGNKNYQNMSMGYYISSYDSCFKGKEIRPFSDDHNYIDLHYKGNTLCQKPTSEIDDLKGIIACKYHICSNSTFSWWGAYLSNRFTVIRPTVYFAGPLSRNDTRDFWPASWMAWDNDYKVDLNDTTFIIPFSYDHKDRADNIMTVYSFLKLHFNTAILIGEVNTEKVIEAIKYKMHRFHRTKVLNDLTRKAETPIVFNWDADVVCSPWNIYKAVEAIRNGADIAYPFKHEFANVARNQLGPFLSSMDCGVFAGRLWPWQRPFKSVGGAVGYNKESFLKAGGENEAFISYAPEDQERFHRFMLLGLKIEKIPGTVFHMEHWRGVNSGEKHSDSARNIAIFQVEKRMTAEQMREYVNGPLYGTNQIPLI